jgi:hypothetical protein
MDCLSESDLLHVHEWDLPCHNIFTHGYSKNGVFFNFDLQTSKPTVCGIKQWQPMKAINDTLYLEIQYILGSNLSWDTFYLGIQSILGSNLSWDPIYLKVQCILRSNLSWDPIYLGIQSILRSNVSWDPIYLEIQSILGSNVSLAFFVPHYAAPSKISLPEDFIENHNYQLSIMRNLARITAFATTILQSHENRSVTSVC